MIYLNWVPKRAKIFLAKLKTIIFGNCREAVFAENLFTTKYKDLEEQKV